MPLEEGQPAPSFTLPDQDGNEVSLDDLKGSPTVVYFYPKDETPGCTRQACDIRDRWSEFTDAGIRVIGISPDTVESHASFRDNHDLPQTLLADPDHEVMERYGAWGEKNMYGKTTVGPIRSAVLLDADNVIVKRWKRIGAKQHADRVLAAAEELLN
ncbi:MAG: thioredoxin-dependent thiol peroxidase [Nitriliruptorales bacterium]|nr:thioredoxin-dependent thiol peroxidase [Nitriliruptorales bacterium]